jgi:hypothetical protein
MHFCLQIVIYDLVRAPGAGEVTLAKINHPDGLLQ